MSENSRVFQEGFNQKKQELFRKHGCCLSAELWASCHEAGYQALVDAAPRLKKLKRQEVSQ